MAAPGLEHGTEPDRFRLAFGALRRELGTDRAPLLSTCGYRTLPVIANGRLYLRDQAKLVCYSISRA